MTSICIDTNAYSEFQRGNREAVAVVEAADHVWFPVISIGELRAGFLNGRKLAHNEMMLGRFLGASAVSLAAPSMDTSQMYAVIGTRLRALGLPIPSNDIWIAASAMELDCPILTFDAHFKRIAGLRVVSCEHDWIRLHS